MSSSFVSVVLGLSLSCSTRARCRRSTRITSSLWWPRSSQRTRVCSSVPPRRTARMWRRWSANIWKSEQQPPGDSSHSAAHADHWLRNLSRFFQGLLAAPRGGEGRPPQGAAGQREWLIVPGVKGHCAVRRGVPPQRADIRGEKTGGGSLLQRGPLPPHLHLHPSCRDQPTCSQVSRSLNRVFSFLSLSSGQELACVFLCTYQSLYTFAAAEVIWPLFDPSLTSVCTQSDPALAIRGHGLPEEEPVQADGGTSRPSGDRLGGREHPDPAGEGQEHGNQSRERLKLMSDEKQWA